MKFHRHYDLLVIAGIALSVRLLYVFQLSHTPFFSSPIVDAEYHDAWAREILNKGIGHEEVYFRAPLYPYFLASIYALTGGSFLAARIAQAVLGAVTAVLTYLLAFEITRRRGLALGSGLGAALYGMLVYFDGELLVETLFIPLLLAACLSYARFMSHRRPFSLLGAGVLLGLAAITRPTALVLLPILILDILLSSESDEGKVIFLRRLSRAFLIVIGCFLPILPVTWHNLQHGGDFVPIASSGGINFYIGNNAQADGMHSSLPGLGSTWDVPAASFAAYQAEGRSLKPSQVSSYYSRLAWQFISSNPGAALKLMLKKFCAFWNRLEISNNRDLYFFKNETRILPLLRILGLWVVAPLGLLGWWIAWRKRMFPGWLIWFVPAYMAAVVAFFVTARFRAPLIPFLLIFAAVAVYDLFFTAPTKPGHLLDHRKLTQVEILIILTIFANTNLWGLKAQNAAHSYFSLGGAFMKAGKVEEARRAYAATLEADSTYPRAHLNLGVLAYTRGDMAEAEEQYQRELALYSRDVRAMNNLGVLRYEECRFDEATELYARALQLEPYYNDARINLAQSLFKLGLAKAEQGDVSSASDLLSQACQLDANKALYHYNYALALGQMGYTGAAQEHLEMALKLAPDLQPARDLLNGLKDASSSEEKGDSASGQPSP